MSTARRNAHGDHENGRDLGGAVGGGVRATHGGGVGHDDKEDCPADQAGGDCRLIESDEPAAEPADCAQERESAQSREARVGAGGVARPLALEPNGHPHEGSHEQVEGKGKVEHYCSLLKRPLGVTAKYGWGR